MMINDSKISVDSDTGTAIHDQQNNPPFTLRVVNPDFYEEDNEPHLANNQYKPTLSSIISSAEIERTPVHPQSPQQQQQIVVVPPPNSWQGNNKEDVNTSEQPQQIQEYKPTVIRKVSKTLIEQQHPLRFQYKKNMDLELLPPLESLPPLLTIDESHLLSPITDSSNDSNMTPSPAPSPSPAPAPPQLPQHHPDFFPSSPTKKSSPSVAQQSVNAMVITTAEELTKSPDEIEQEDLNKKLESSSINQHHQPADHRRQSRDLLREQSPPSAVSSTSTRPHLQHVRQPSLTPSLTPSSIYPTHMHQQQQQSSRYSKASYSLTNHPDAIKLYRTMALKTKDRTVQLTYAKYLLEVASLYDGQRRPFRPNLSLSLPLLKRSRRGSSATNGSVSRPASINSRRSSMDTHISVNTLNTMRRDSVNQQSFVDEGEEASKRKKRKMLEEEGVRWIKRLAKEHVGEAAYLLALWFDRGMYGFRKSTTKALKFYEIAANEKVPEAMFAVGQYHEREQDYMTSFQLYEDAASLGLVEALYVSIFL